MNCDGDRKTIGVEGGELEIWTLRTRPHEERAPDFYILSFIGVGDRAEEWATVEVQTWRECSAEIWIVNYPGYGGSSGAAALKSIPPSALAAYDALEKRAAGRPIVVSGNSLGGAVALYVAASRPAAGAILRNPPPLRSLILGRYGWWNLWIGAGIVASQIPEALDSVANARRVHVPGLFLLSSDDDVVPPSYVQDVVQAYDGPRRVVVVEGGHDTIVGPDESAKLRGALRWLAAESGAASGAGAQVR